MQNYNSENNDIFDMDNDFSMYKEPWQYTTWRTTHKSPKKDEDGKPVTEDPSDLSTLTVIRYSTYINKFAVGIKDFTFDELIQATRLGHSLKRIGTTPQGTRILVIDLDNDGNENITPEELNSFCTDKIRWTPGGSGRPYRYHLFVFLAAPIVTIQEFQEKSEWILKKLAEHIGRFDKIVVDEHQFRFLQWCYGVPQNQLEHMEEEELPGTLYRCRQIRKNKNYKIEKVDPKALKEEKTLKEASNNDESKPLMPYNSAMLASQLNEDQLFPKRNSDGSYLNHKICLEGKRFDIFEPRMKKQTVKIGKRFSTAQAWIYRLVPQYFRCKSLGLEYTEDDLTHTFYTLCKRNFADFISWWNETGQTMVKSLMNELHTNDGLEYSEIVDKYRSSHSTELYKRLGYNMATIMDIVENYAIVSKENSTATFTSKADLEEILKEKHVSYSSCMHYMSLLDLKVIYQKDNRKASKYDYLKTAAIEGTYYYMHYNEAHKKYCKRNGIRYASMFKLYSGTRKQYEAIVAATDKAIKAMYAYFDKCDQSPSIAHPPKKKEDVEEEPDIELPY